MDRSLFKLGFLPSIKTGFKSQAKYFWKEASVNKNLLFFGGESQLIKRNKNLTTHKYSQLSTCVTQIDQFIAF